jgi:hypothetical protein
MVDPVILFMTTDWAALSHKSIFQNHWMSRNEQKKKRELDSAYKCKK